MAGTDLPDVRSDADVPADAPSYDVVVVGFGIAGGCAALEAARAGARVLLLERAAVHGGTSSLSGGHFYLGGGTAVQLATGHEDSVEEMVKYLTAISKEPEPDKIRAYCEGSVEHFDWLETLGFEFERSYYPEKAVIQPGTQGLMFTGNEKVWPYLDQARPAPRGHKVPVPGDTEGTKMVMDLLRDRVEEAGVEVRYETGATHLVTSPSGDVVGVAWRSLRRDRGRARRRGGARGRRLRDEPRHGRRVHARARLEAVHARLDVRRRARHPARRVGRRRAQAHGRAVHHRAVLPAVGAGEGADRQQARRAVRRRGQLPRADVVPRDAAARAGGVPDRRQRAHGGPADVAVPVDRRLGDGRGDGGRASTCPPARWPGPSTATTSTPPAARTPTSTSTPTGWRRRTPARGAPTTSPSARRCTPASPSAACG